VDGMIYRLVDVWLDDLMAGWLAGWVDDWLAG